MVDDAKTIKLYFPILKFLKLILVHITINEASRALKNVIRFALSVAININHIITGNT